MGKAVSRSSAQNVSALRVEKLGTHIGAEISGVDFTGRHRKGLARPANTILKAG